MTWRGTAPRLGLALLVLCWLSSAPAPGQARHRVRLSPGPAPAGSPFSSRAGIKADHRAGKCWGPHTQLHHTHGPKTQAQMNSRVEAGLFLPLGTATIPRPPVVTAGEWPWVPPAPQNVPPGAHPAAGAQPRTSPAWRWGDTPGVSVGPGMCVCPSPIALGALDGLHPPALTHLVWCRCHRRPRPPAPAARGSPRPPPRGHGAG